jgi:hypothetical protein
MQNNVAQKQAKLQESFKAHEKDFGLLYPIIPLDI